MYIEVWEFVLLNVMLWFTILVTCYYDTKEACPNKLDFKNKTVIINTLVAVLATTWLILSMSVYIPNRSKVLNEVCEDRMVSKLFLE